MKNVNWVMGGVVAILGTLAFADGSPSPTANSAVSIHVLTDSAKRTLYTLDTDAPNVSNCTGDCLVEWPPFLADGVAVPADSAPLAVFNRTDGRKQFSYKGRPLYYFDEDLHPGDALGSEDDGIWHVVPLAAPAPDPTPTVTPVPFQVVSGCQAADYVDGANGALITTPNGFSPKCLRLHVGSSVSIKGSAMHPVQGMAAVLGLANPFAGEAATAGLVTKTLTAAGFYGYYCAHHGTPQGGGMAGSIQVVP